MKIGFSKHSANMRGNDTLEEILHEPLPETK
jgi:hypothetical protein